MTPEELQAAEAAARRVVLEHVHSESFVDLSKKLTTEIIKAVRAVRDANTPGGGKVA